VRDCLTCKVRDCQHSVSLSRTRDANGRPYPEFYGNTRYDYVATAYNHRTKQYETYTGTISVGYRTPFIIAVAAHIRNQDKDAWLCNAVGSPAYDDKKFREKFSDTEK
jgi:hypothetical protein